MLSSSAASIQQHFADLTDPRTRKVTYPLVNVVTMSLCAVLGGADDFVAIADWAEDKKEWLSQFLDMSSGVPSHDRFNAILGAIKPAEFEKCLLSWITALHEVTDGQIIAIDGKTLRRSFDAASSKAAIHMVSAWATANHVSLGQVATDAKSNEITAIPKLLEIIEVSGCLVTIDAMGCQKEIAEKIVKQGGDYCLAIKGNQRYLHQAIRDHFVAAMEVDFAKMKVHRHETHEKGHGREESRYYYLCPIDADDFPYASKWKHVKAIGITINIVKQNGKETSEVRHYILSKYLTGKRFAEAVRGHWSIENSLHWQLDVTFGEDQSRIRKGHADVNFSLLRRTSLSLLKNNKTAKVGVKNKRLKAGRNDAYLLEVLLGT